MLAPCTLEGVERKVVQGFYQQLAPLGDSLVLVYRDLPCPGSGIWFLYWNTVHEEQKEWVVCGNISDGQSPRLVAGMVERGDFGSGNR